jgi:hypothetical protein
MLSHQSIIHLQMLESTHEALKTVHTCKHHVSTYVLCRLGEWAYGTNRICQLVALVLIHTREETLHFS